MNPTVILSAAEARLRPFPYRYAQISIIDPGGQLGFKEWPLVEDPNRIALLRCEFWDVRMGDYEKLGDTIRGYIPRANEVAPIVPFVRKWRDKVDGFVINCAAGISRSSGVAAGINPLLFGKDNERFYLAPFNPNPNVRNLIRAAY